MASIYLVQEKCDYAYHARSGGFCVMRKLGELEFKNYFVSHLGCIKGCIEYLGLEISTPWLFGGTGHAFIINIHEALCPSGPTGWKTTMLYELGRNLGFDIHGIFGQTTDEVKEETWNFVRKAIDDNHPCYGWQLGNIPDFYVIYGYDDEGYYYKGYDAMEGTGPLVWKDLGKMFIEVYSVKKGKVVDDSIVVKGAFENAIKHSKNPEEWRASEKYKAGLKGFDQWITAVSNGTADGFGLGYNSAVWAECRRYAVEFLKEANNRLGKQNRGLFDEAIKHYEIVAESLTKVSNLYPHPYRNEGPIAMDEKSKEATRILKTARDAEAKGLKVLEELTRVIK